MTKEELRHLQEALGLSDGKMASSLGVTRQTWRNWRTGRACPEFAQNSLRWLMELRKLSPSNDNIPKHMRFTTGILLAAGGVKMVTYIAVIAA